MKERAASARRLMLLDVPDAPELLEELGKVSLRHAHLDYILRLTIKSLTGVAVDEALDATEYEGSESLRKRIVKLARARIGECEVLVKLQALMRRCDRASRERNNLLHNVWVQDPDGGAGVRVTRERWEALPTVAELENLGLRLQGLVSELNKARLHGYFAAALKAKRQGKLP